MGPWEGQKRIDFMKAHTGVSSTITGGTGNQETKRNMT